jgi:hypothetical protein
MVRVVERAWPAGHPRRGNRNSLPEPRKTRCAGPLPGTPTGQEPVGSKPPEPKDKRIFFIIPNYRTFPSLTNYQPLSTKEKYKIATQDAFDPGTIVLGAAFAGQGQLSNSNREFGQGVKGYAQYWATSYTDFVIGDYMTEAVFPSLFHQDPRYFRRGTGSVLSRLGFSMGQIFWTHNDSGTSAFNISEVAGNASAVAISQAYYQGGRDAGSAVQKLSTQLGVDMASNVLKEFWPDVSRKFSRKHSSETATASR